MREGHLCNNSKLVQEQRTNCAKMDAWRQGIRGRPELLVQKDGFQDDGEGYDGQLGHLLRARNSQRYIQRREGKHFAWFQQIVV